MHKLYAGVCARGGSLSAAGLTSNVSSRPMSFSTDAKQGVGRRDRTWLTTCLGCLSYVSHGGGWISIKSPSLSQVNPHLSFLSSTTFPPLDCLLLCLQAITTQPLCRLQSTGSTLCLSSLCLSRRRRPLVAHCLSWRAPIVLRRHLTPLLSKPLRTLCS